MQSTGQGAHDPKKPSPTAHLKNRPFSAVWEQAPGRAPGRALGRAGQDTELEVDRSLRDGRRVGVVSHNIRVGMSRHGAWGDAG